MECPICRISITTWMGGNADEERYIKGIEISSGHKGNDAKRQEVYGTRREICILSSKKNNNPGI